ncbi:MAG: glycosyltransferase family 2 protein [Prolixibacteraceae bacterium]|jgi:glycosyltransferase involved in cell wall biosynthesis
MRDNKHLISVIILTLNEEIHIERCLKNASLLSTNVFIVDSNSSDKTVALAKQYTNNIFQGNFDSFSSKLNWAIENLPITTPWTIRLDADEIFTDKFLEKVNSVIESQLPEVSGIYVRRQLWFLNRWMKHGDMYPTYSLRIWKSGSVSCENRLLDEHMILKEGISINSELDIIDNPKTSIRIWIEKHNKYSELEVLSQLNSKSNLAPEIKTKLISKKQEESKRFFKDRVYYKLPLFIRPFLYFFYRYFLKLGFLDGKEGFIWNVLHAFWYRFLIDVKIYESRKTLL